MGRWGAVREGSNSSELPLFPPSPKPPPQARSAHPSSPAKPRFRSPWSSLTLLLGATWGRVAGVPPALASPQPGPVPSEGRGAQSWASSYARWARAGLRGCLGSGWRQADAAQPPGGARVRLGGLPRPALAWPRPAPAWPRPQSAV